MHILLESLLIFLISIYAFLESFIKLFIPAKRKSVRGETVLITGAGHGIGRLTATEFAKLQTTLILWDINKVGVQETAEECRRLGATVHTYQVDCCQREEVYSTAEKIKRDIGDVSILINNAGVVVCAELLTIPDHQIQRTFDVNIMAHFWMLKAFLPAMMKNNRGHIVTVASICGHLSLPQMVDYCSSKFAAVGLHIALTAELAALGKDGIKTSCLCPVFVNTGFVKNPHSRIWPILTPKDVVKELMNGVLTNTKMIFVPPSARFFVLMDRIFPERITDAVNRLQDASCEAPVACEDKDK